MTISIIICTYNRSELLNNLLRSFSQQIHDFSDFEIIVIDNNSNDKTKSIIKEYEKKYPNFYYFLEKKQGLSNARNKGYQVAKGKYVGYVDDDCKVPNDYLRNAKDFIEAYQPDVFGGPYFSFYNTPKPLWFKDEYGSHTPFEKTKKIEGAIDEILHGGNLFFKREILESSKGFDPKLGMIGDEIAYGEETALMKHIKQNRPETSFYFAPSVSLFHLVRKNKMTWGWLIPQRFTHGRWAGRVSILSKVNSPNIGSGVLNAVKIIIVLFSGFFIFSHFRDRKKQPQIKHYFYEKLLPQILFLGMRYEEIKASF